MLNALGAKEAAAPISLTKIENKVENDPITEKKVDIKQEEIKQEENEAKSPVKIDVNDVEIKECSKKPHKAETKPDEPVLEVHPEEQLEDDKCLPGVVKELIAKVLFKIYHLRKAILLILIAHLQQISNFSNLIIYNNIFFSSYPYIV